MNSRIARLLSGVLLALVMAPVAQAQQANCTQNALVRVINAGTGGVDILINGQRVVTNVQQGTATGFGSIPSGAAKLQINATGTETVLVQPIDVTFVAGGRQTIAIAAQAATGGQSTSRTTVAQVVTEEVAAPAAGQARVRVLNTSADAGAVDVLLNDQKVATNLAFANASPFVDLPPGKYALRINTTGTTTTLAGPTDVDLVVGRVYTIVTQGLVSDKTLAANLVVDLSFDAQTRFVNASPNAGAIDFLVDGKVVATNVAFGASGPFVQLPSGASCAAVAATGTTTPVLASLPLDLQSGSRQTVVLLGTTGGTTPTLTTVPFPDPPTPPATGKAKVRVIHAVAGAGPVDVYSGDVKLFSNVEFGKAADFIEVDPGTLAVRVTQAGATTTLFGPTDVPVAAGQTVTIVLRGQSDNAASLGFVVITDTTTGTG
jgi:hypothetical protein